MSHTKRIVQPSTSHLQYLAGLSIAAALAFTLGHAIGSAGRVAVPATAVDQTGRAAVSASAAGNQPAADLQHAVPAVTELYDGGWAGGPGPGYVPRATSTVRRVPYDAGWKLYDNGWAGGPAASTAVTSTRLVPARVPYEAGWQLYDGGWAGGPKTLP